MFCIVCFYFHCTQHLIVFHTCCTCGLYEVWFDLMQMKRNRTPEPEDSNTHIIPDSVSSEEQLILPQSVKHFKFLAEKLLNTLQPAWTRSSDDLTQQLGQYLTEVQTISSEAESAFTAREFWKTRQAIYQKLAAAALDILAASASQAYVERLFSVCGLLLSGHRNCMTRSLTVCLKINMDILRSVGVLWLTQKRKWMQNVHHNPDTSEWLSLTKPTLSYEWCSLYWRVKITQNSLHAITVCCFFDFVH